MKISIKATIIMLIVITTFLGMHHLNAMELEEDMAESFDANIFSEEALLRYELDFCKTFPDSGDLQQFFSRVNCLVALSDTMPLLCQIVEDLAHKAQIKTPLLLIYTGNNKDWKFYARGVSLWRNCSCIIIPERSLKNHTVDELKAVIAHELSHIASNDMSKRILFLLGQLPLRILTWGKLSDELAVAFNSIARYQEVQADLGAVKLLGDSSGLISYFERDQALQARPGCRVRTSYSDTPLREYHVDHPLYEQRKEYLKPHIKQS